MKSLNICIDIDGTITDAYYWLGLCNEYFNKNVSEDEVKEYDIHKVFGVALEDYNKFYEKYKFRMHWEQKIRHDAKAFINKLSGLHNIYFVTARDKSLTMLTHSYLRKNDIHYDDLFVLGSHYKVDMARTLVCDIFIEDNYDNAVQLSTAGFKVLLIDTNYNRHALNQNITRVYGWNQIYEIIDKLLLQNEAM